ncbi:MAG: DUF1501 domain-containing protein [Candidatus Eremiobacteraeota bacterium]|nr:DUF1501 domain-containing protein [Candidatus Eremiobacteraeota bacterium]
MQRRNFLKTCAQALFLASLGPALTWERALAAPRNEEAVLVAVHLQGGNDALNTLPPLTDSLYRKARPHLALSARSTPTLAPGRGIHPSLSGLHHLYQEGKVAFVEGVGRPDHDRSHFRSIDIWQTAGNPTGSEGWLGMLAERHQLTSVSVGDQLAHALANHHHQALSFTGETMPQYPGGPDFHASLARMYSEPAEAGLRRAILDSGKRLEEVVVDYRDKTARVRLPRYFGDNPTGRRFEMAARILAAGLPPRVLHLGVGSFDTHEDQANQQARQLAELDTALAAFWQTMEEYGLAHRVLVFGYSEFGRRVEENATGGTDHGAGGLAFLLGGKVQGGLRGTPPDLSALRDGDLAHSVDYRRLYASILEGHFNHSDAASIVPGHAALPGLF